MRRVSYYHVLLFLVSYVCAVVYLRPSATVVKKLKDSAMQVAPTMASVLQSTPRNANSAPHASQSRVHTAPKMIPAEVATEAAELPTLPPVVLNVDYASPPNAYSTLDTVTQSDERPEYRLAAVGALRNLAANGDADGRIRETLRMATADGDPRVAAAADVAYREALAWADR